MITAKRQRRAQGSCWPCKQRCVKCDRVRRSVPDAAGALCRVPNAIQQDILNQLDSTYRTPRFNPLLGIRAALEDLWCSQRQEGDWGDIFSRLGNHVLVL